MGLFDDAVPGGNITKPLLIALGALLAGKMLSGGQKEDEPEAEPKELPRQTSPQNNTTAQTEPGQGGLLEGGLGGLLERLAKNGQGDVADSWVKTDRQNAPIAPQDLGKAIGGRMLSELSRRTGIPEDQLLDQLSKALPGIVDKLTPNGSVPSSDQVAGQFRNNPW
ncbi:MULTISPECIES: YidB family protein [Mesorhizobium]|uniref:DUF937 domain-containing protein n=1 Tax=Mesorhizobium denitrificans TaxID=2294114 RepID=A0A371X6N5_9HYPH|nr:MULTISPECIES: YidB family protein [Mesorhizobium]RFC64892.1 DUF937 domain-containing protein [Mesorhizobium denitrificans]